ncbi:MAG: hypothetical protein JKX76_04780 [Colwellia sp.]|nr:hypothetical protein [Colwellia sp.]
MTYSCVDNINIHLYITNNDNMVIVIMLNSLTEESESIKLESADNTT